MDSLAGMVTKKKSPDHIGGVPGGSQKGKKKIAIERRKVINKG